MMDKGQRIRDLEAQNRELQAALARARALAHVGGCTSAGATTGSRRARRHL